MLFGLIGESRKKLPGKNLCDPSQMVPGQVNSITGALETSSVCWRSGYIIASQSNSYTWSGINPLMSTTISFYNSNKSYLSRTGGATTGATRTFPTPSNCAFFIIATNFYADQPTRDADLAYRKTCTQVELGAVPTSYVPF